MKRKIICLVLLLAFAVSVFSGCILPVNNERDMKQVIATVSYKGNVAKVTKLEVIEQYYSYGSTYVNSYGMTPEEAFTYLLEQLANRKLLVLDAIDRNVGGIGVEWDNENSCIVKTSMAAEDLNRAQDEVNTQLEDVFKNYVETVNEEYYGDEEEEEEEPEEEKEEDNRTVRPLPELEEEEDKDYTKTVDSWFANFNYATDWEKYECKDKNVARVAFNRLKKLLEDQYKSEEIFLQSQYEQIIIEKLQEEIFGQVNVTDAEVVARYEANLRKNEATFNANDSAYASAFSSNEVLYYHPETGYATVKHVLLAFEEADLKDRKVENTHIFFDGDYTLTEFEERRSSGNYSDDAISAYRAKLAETIKVNNYGDFADWWNDGATYDEEEMKDLVDWRDLLYDKDNTPMSYDFKSFFDIIRTSVNAQADNNAKLDKFTDYIFGYSNPDDKSMFNNVYDYTVTADEDSYMEEFTAICKHLISGDALPDSVNYGSYGDEAGKVGSMGWCVTDYGVHLVMVSYVARGANTDANGYYLIDTADVQSAVAAMKGIEIGDTDHTTLYDYIFETLKGAKETSAISNYQQNLIDREAKNALTVNQDIIDALFN